MFLRGINILKSHNFFYLQTGANLEIDLIIDRPGMPIALVEIKSATNIHERHLESLRSVHQDMPQAQAFCLCLESRARKVGRIEVLPWQEGIRELGL